MGQWCVRMICQRICEWEGDLWASINSTVMQTIHISSMQIPQMKPTLLANTSVILLFFVCRFYHFTGSFCLHHRGKVPMITNRHLLAQKTSYWMQTNALCITLYSCIHTKCLSNSSCIQWHNMQTITADIPLELLCKFQFWWTIVNNCKNILIVFISFYNVYDWKKHVCSSNYNSLRLNIHEWYRCFYLKLQIAQVWHLLSLYPNRICSTCVSHVSCQLRTPEKTVNFLPHWWHLI